MSGQVPIGVISALAPQWPAMSETLPGFSAAAVVRDAGIKTD